MNTTTYFPLIKKPHIPPPSKPPLKPHSSSPTKTTTTLPPISHGLLLSSSSDPLAPLELRIASLPSFPCTAIVSPISQSPSLYPLTHPANTLTTIPTSPLSSHASPSLYTPQTSLPGLIDKLAGPELPKWREEHWPEGLNAGACGVSPSFRLADLEGGNQRIDGDRKIRDMGEDCERPKYIIHTHAPNFADKSYSTPLVKQLLANCYRGALVEAMGISEREEKEELERVGVGTEEKAECEGGGDADARMGGIDTEINREETDSVDGLDTIMTNTNSATTQNEARTTNLNLNTLGPCTPSSTFISGSPSSPLPSPSLPQIPPNAPLLFSPKPHSPNPKSKSKPNPKSQPRSRQKGIVLALPALSTGFKNFPHRLAARIAVGTARDFLKHPVFGEERRRRIARVVFCVWPVDSPNRKALQVAFGLMFPPPLPQSAPLSPVSCQLATPPFSPLRKVRRGVDGGGGEGEEGVGLWVKVKVMGRERGEGEGEGIPKIFVTPPLSRVASGGEREVESVGERGLEGTGLRGGREGVADGRIEKVGKGFKERKESYKQKKRKQGLRLAAANREKRQREMEGKIEVNGDTISQIGKTDTRTPERMPGVEEGNEKSKERERSDG